MHPRVSSSILVAGATGVVLAALTAKGKLTLDVGWGRSRHALGPVVITIAAPRELVYEQLASPYLSRTPRALRTSLEVLDRGTDLVLARHYSDVGPFIAETVETVGFEPPRRITFRHVRGPVPYAVEEFVLDGDGDVTDLTYRGELGIDFWLLGRAAAKVVAPTWERVVMDHLDEVKAAVERRAQSRARRADMR